MVFQPCPNIAQLELIGGMQQQVMENVFHVEKDAGWDATSLFNMVDRATTAWIANIVPHLSTDYTLLRGIGTDLTTQSSPRVVQTIYSGGTGSDAGANLPNNVALCFKWDTGLRGRSQRGRTYLGGLTENSVQNSNITSAFEALIIPALALFRTALNSVAGEKMVVLSRRNGNAPRAAGIGTPIVTVALVDGYSDSQRRRLPGHNRHH